jgi:hypothetical protein
VTGAAATLSRFLLETLDARGLEEREAVGKKAQ